jgi:hypothetical protein
MPFDSVTYVSCPIRAALAQMLEWFEDESHWCQGVMRRRGAACLMGAIPYASKRPELIVELLVQALPYPYQRIVDFNDEPNTTIHDIRALIRRAMEIAP